MKKKFGSFNVSGKHVYLTANVCAAEPAVGIFFPWLEDMEVMDVYTGQEVLLSEGELNYLEEKALGLE